LFAGGAPLAAAVHMRRFLIPTALMAALVGASSCDTSSAAAGSQTAPAAEPAKKKPAPRPDAGAPTPDAGQHGSGSSSGGTPPREYR
jgi:hypothetical protein